MEENIPVQGTSSPGAQAAAPDAQNLSPAPKKNKPFWIILIGIIVTLLVAGAAGWYLLANSVKTQKIYHIGILSGLNYFSDIPGGFKEKMTELGYTEGKNVTYDLRQTDFNMDTYKSILTKFISDKSDLILVFPTEAAQLAKSMTSGTKIPIVFIGANIEDANLIKSVREPGGNLTGVRWTGSDITLLRYEAMREIVPLAKRYIVPFQNGVTITTGQLVSLHNVADKDGIKILEIPADNLSDLKEKIDFTRASNTDAVFCILDPLTPSPQGTEILNNFAKKYNIPISGTVIPLPTESNSLFFINPVNVEMGKQAAELAVKVLRGSPAGKLPVSTAEPRLIINYRAIQKMGLNVSEGMLSKASEIMR